MDCPPGIAFGDPEGRLLKSGNDERNGAPGAAASAFRSTGVQVTASAVI
jgi:hypothetical protein